MRIILVGLFCLAPLAAQKHEFGFLLGGLLNNSRDSVRLSGDKAFQFNYAYRLANLGRLASVSAEAHFLADPQRTVTSPILTATRDVATLYLTPGLRVKFRPGSRLSPFAAAGAGWALYEQSVSQLNGQPNPAPRTVNRGVFAYGAGADYRILPRLALRGEIRDFYSGNPALNVPGLGGGRHNVVVSGGFVIRIPE